jgi:hypothetical protein
MATTTTIGLPQTPPPSALWSEHAIVRDAAASGSANVQDDPAAEATAADPAAGMPASPGGPNTGDDATSPTSPTTTTLRRVASPDRALSMRENMPFGTLDLPYAVHRPCSAPGPQGTDLCRGWVARVPPDAGRFYAPTPRFVTPVSAINYMYTACRNWLGVDLLSLSERYIVVVGLQVPPWQPARR